MNVTVLRHICLEVGLRGRGALVDGVVPLHLVALPAKFELILPAGGAALVGVDLDPRREGQQCLDGREVGGAARPCERFVEHSLHQRSMRLFGGLIRKMVNIKPDNQR